MVVQIENNIKRQIAQQVMRVVNISVLALNGQDLHKNISAQSATFPDLMCGFGSNHMWVKAKDDPDNRLLFVEF